MKYIRPPDFESVRKLQAYYEKVEREISALLTSDPSVRTSAQLNKKMQDALHAATAYLSHVNRDFARDELAAAFVEGNKSVDKPHKYSLEEARTVLAAQGYKYAKNGLTRDTYIELQSATQSAGFGLKKRVNGVIERLRKEGNDSVYNVQQAILEDLKRNGLLTVEYANGAKQPLHAYAAMAARSARIESANIGTIGAALQAGTDYLEMTTMPQCCKLCGAYQGKVYCISGKDNRFPALFKTVLRRGYALPHPNCRHEFLAYFLETESSEGVRKAIENSKIRYDKNGNLVDVRWQRAIKEYAAWQAGNRQLNREALEFQRMQAHYGENVPYKTLGAFRREVRKPSDKQSPTMRQWKNRNADEKEYQDIKRLFGEKAPESFDIFNEIKYNKENQELYNSFRLAILDDRIKQRLGSERYPLTVQEDKQGKHIQGHKNFQKDKSYLAVDSVEEGQVFADSLIRKYCGKGEMQRDKNGKWNSRELIVANKTIGYVKSLDGSWMPTNRFLIHYSKVGTHIVPTLKNSEVKK